MLFKVARAITDCRQIFHIVRIFMDSTKIYRLYYVVVSGGGGMTP